MPQTDSNALAKYLRNLESLPATRNIIIYFFAGTIFLIPSIILLGINEWSIEFFSMNIAADEVILILVQIIFLIIFFVSIRQKPSNKV